MLVDTFSSLFRHSSIFFLETSNPPIEKRYSFNSMADTEIVIYTRTDDLNRKCRVRHGLLLLLRGSMEEIWLFCAQAWKKFFSSMGISWLRMVQRLYQRKIKKTVYCLWNIFQKFCLRNKFSLTFTVNIFALFLDLTLRGRAGVSWRLFLIRTRCGICASLILPLLDHSNKCSPIQGGTK